MIWPWKSSEVLKFLGGLHLEVTEEERRAPIQCNQKMVGQSAEKWDSLKPLLYLTQRNNLNFIGKFLVSLRTGTCSDQNLNLDLRKCTSEIFIRPTDFHKMLWYCWNSNSDIDFFFCFFVFLFIFLKIVIILKIWTARCRL